MSLFKTPTRSEIRSINHAILYAITLHPHKRCKFNRKNYGNYTNDQQIKLLAQIEVELRLKNPSIELIELHYEIAPNTGNIHLHGLYSMPPIYQSTIVTYYRRLLDINTSTTRVPWRHLDLTVIQSREAWITYIRKDIV